MIEVSEQTIDRIHTILAGVEKADEKVLKPALTRGLMAGKTAAKKQAVSTYRIKPSTFDEKTYIDYKGVKIGTNEVIGNIAFAGRVMPLIKFKVSPGTPKKKTTPSAAVLKASSLVKFNRQKNVFVAQMKSGHIGIMERQKGTVSPTTGKEKLKELLSPATPQMVGNEKVMQNVKERVNEVINQRIEHEIERLLSKRGG